MEGGWWNVVWRNGRGPCGDEKAVVDDGMGMQRCGEPLRG